jgi:Secretion system C-terminal sorting domain
MKNKYALVSLFLALTHFTIRAQCPLSWVFVSPTNDYTNVNGYYEASQSITANNKVTGTSRITYDAGVFVKLLAYHPTTLNPDGFKAQTAVFFKAIIDGCGGIVKTKDVTLQGINLHVTPNPTSEIFTFELPSTAISSVSFRITDLLGRLMVEKQADRGSLIQTVEAATFQKGIYFLQVISEGKVVAMEKFVKQ